MTRFELELYISGQTLRSRKAVAQLQSICRQLVPDDHDLSIIDVLEQPQVAEKMKIIATPTLIRRTPEPTQRIIGDFSDQETVINVLGLDS